MGIKNFFLILILGSLCFSLLNCSKANAAPKKSEISPVLDPTDDSIEAFGQVKPEKKYNIHIDFSARIEKIYKKEGDKIKKNEPVIKLSLNKFNKELYEIEYNLLEAKMDLKKLQNENYQAGTGKYELQKMKIRNLEFELKMQQEKIKKCHIVNENIISTVENGTMTELNYSAGDLISDKKKVCTILDLDHLVIEADIPEEFAKDIAIGNPAIIIPVFDNTKKIPGKIKKISNLAHEKNNEAVIKVTISLENQAEAHLLKPNYNVDVIISPSKNLNTEQKSSNLTTG